MTEEQMAWRKRLTLGLLLMLALVLLTQRVMYTAPAFVSADTVCPDGGAPIQHGETHPYPGDPFPFYVCP